MPTACQRAAQYRDALHNAEGPHGRHHRAGRLASGGRRPPSGADSDATGARPAGTPSTTSSINFVTGTTLANAFTSGLGPAGLTITSSGTAANSYQLIVDITAYLT
jgi:hypothetical protein